MGGIFGAIGSQQQAQALGMQGQMYSQQGDQALALSKVGSADALARGNQQAGVIQTKGSQLAGAQQVGFAASGVDTQSGSPLSAMADTRMMSAMDQATVKNNAAREAWGIQVAGLNKYQQDQMKAYGSSTAADQASLRAKGELVNSVFSLGTSSFLGGGGGGGNSGSGWGGADT